MSGFTVIVNDDVSAGSTMDRLCRLYWETSEDGSFRFTVKQLAEELGVAVHEVSKAVSANCVATVDTVSCPDCGTTATVKSRSEISRVSRLGSVVCAQCRAEASAARRLAQEVLTSKRQDVINQRFAIADGHPIPSAEDLDIAPAFMLAALLEDGDEVAQGGIPALADRGDPFTPTADMDIECIRTLRTSELIRVHPGSSLDAFAWDGESYLGTYYPAQAMHYIKGSGSLEHRVAMYREGFNAVVQRGRWPERWIDGFSDFWLEVAIAECTSYLVSSLSRHGLSFKPGAKTRDVLSRGLQIYSIGQMYYFIWRAVRDAAAYSTERAVNAKQAANSAVGRIDRQIDRAYGEGWEVSVFKRDSRDAVSTLSQLLFSRALALPDPLAYSPLKLPARRVAQRLNWSVLESDAFEALMYSLVSEAEGYENVDWLMHTNAPDRGRDVSAFRLRRDPLSGHQRQRVVIQCKHWLTKSIRDEDISQAVTSVSHWEDPPFDVLVMATSGRFTADAVAWAERHNGRGVRPSIELWNDARLEDILAQRPHLVVQFGLR